MDLKSWLDFKVRNRYLDLPNENYRPLSIALVLNIVNKMYFMFSIFGLCWWVILYSSAFLDAMVTTTLVFIMFVLVLALFWMVGTKSLPIESFLIVLIFMIGSSLVWLVRFTP